MPALPAGVRTVTERADGVTGLYVQPEWTVALPWLCHGITSRSADMSLFGAAPVGEVLPRWRELRDRLGCQVVVHTRQVHGDRVLEHAAVPAGLYLGPDADGHVTAQPGVLVAVSVADCVPIAIVAPGHHVVGLLHAGWRSVAAGILERGIDAVRRRTGGGAAELLIHLGPSICGECFEVGPEVPQRLGLAMDDGGKGADRRSHVDLRAELARRAIDRGTAASNVTVSTFCTRCGDSPFFSHRGGCAERQIAVLGVRGMA